MRYRVIELEPSGAIRFYTSEYFDEVSKRWERVLKYSGLHSNPKECEEDIKYHAKRRETLEGFRQRKALGQDVVKEILL